MQSQKVIGKTNSLYVFPCCHDSNHKLFQYYINIRSDFFNNIYSNILNIQSCLRIENACVSCQNGRDMKERIVCV